MKYKTGLVIAVLPFFHSVCAFASASDHHQVGVEHLTWYAINFVLYLVILVYLTKKPFARFWESRRLDIQEKVTRGERELAAVQSELNSANEKLSSLTPEYLKQIQAKIELEGEKEAEQIILDSLEQVARIEKQAEQTIEAEKKAGLAQVRQEIASVVIKRAESKIKASYGNDKDRIRRNGALAGVRALLG